MLSGLMLVVHFIDIMLVKYKANIIIIIISPNVVCPHHEGRRGRDRMVVRFTMTYAISAYHH
jgi:hypothetical protein